jgi:hypothetical protein
VRSAARSILTVLVIACASRAEALQITRTSSGALPVEANLGIEVFGRFKGSKIPGGAWSKRLSLQRARLEIEIELGKLVRGVLEPDFAGQDADLADAFIDLRPIRELRLRVGQAKTPFGILETTSRFRLPSISRGLVSEVVSDRLGFGGREIGGSAEVRLKDVALKPELIAGGYGDFSTDAGGDAAARLTLKPLKGGEIQLAGYHRASALIRGSHGNAGAIGFVYDREGGFGALELFVGRARLLRKDGLISEQDATFLAARGLFGFLFGIDEEWGVEPFFGAEVLDPDGRTTGDLGIDLRGGASLRWREALRVSIEADLQRGQDGFVVPDLISLTALVAVALE